MLSQEYQMLKELFEEKIDRLHDLQMQTLEQAKKTNGRVNRAEEKIEKLEADTALISSLAKNKTIIVIILLLLSGTSATSIIDFLK